MDKRSNWEKDEVLQRFREYLKIPSVHPDVDYGDCVKFLQRQADELGLPMAVYELVPNKPVVVVTCEGSQPELPAILLNSHMDVVPVYEEHWTHPPFEAHISEDGFIYARGTQDTKGLGMLYLEAIRRLQASGEKLKRTLHVSFVPDEEIGGVDGMKTFSVSEEFKKLNIGFSLDESAPSPDQDSYYAFHGERTLRQIKVTCKGKPAHGSFLETNTAGEKIYYMIDKLMKMRNEELQKLNTGIWLGEVTTINLTKLEGGVQVNVLPESLTAYFDIRVAPQVDHDELDNTIANWCKEAGEDVTYEYLVKNPQVRNTDKNGSVAYWNAITATVNEMGKQIKCVICPGGTDSRYIRELGIPAFNFTPIDNTPTLLHAHDERVHVDEYKKGIDVMEKVLIAVANV